MTWRQLIVLWAAVGLCSFATPTSGPGSGQAGGLTADFTPCWGAPQGLAITPAIGRALIATSPNGVDFQRPPDPKIALVVDRIGVPDAVVLPSGRILLYFVAGCKFYAGAEHKVDEIAVGVSDTNGSDWVFKNVEFVDVPPDLVRPVDPNVVLLPSGDLSLFVTMWVGQDPRPRIYSFRSADGGFTYVFQGLRYDPKSSPDGIVDPENYRFSATSWQILTGGEGGHALSTNGGETFESLGRFPDAAVVHDVSVTDTPGAYRAYTPGPGGTAIKSYRSDVSPWTTWRQESGERLTLSATSTMESCEVVFPTVVKTASNGYLMVYQTTIPGCNCPGKEARCVPTCPAEAVPAGGDAPLQVQFAGSTNAAGWVPAPAYSWSFGDGGAATGASPSHTYTSAGTYPWTVTLSAGGETCTSSGTVVVGHAPFTDPILVPGVTVIKAVHVLELRSRTDAVRLARGLGTFAWAEPLLMPGATLVKAAHVGELRMVLAATYEAAGRIPPTWASPTPAPGAAVTASAILELRAAVWGIE